MEENHISETRLVSHQFDALVLPFVFQKVHLDLALAQDIESPGTAKTDWPVALQQTAKHATRYARYVTLYPNDHHEHTVRAIRHMRNFRVLTFRFNENVQMEVDKTMINALCENFLNFEIRIQSGSNRMSLVYAIRIGRPIAELQSIDVDVRDKLIGRTLTLADADWNSIESITTNKYLRVESPTAKCNLRTLKINGNKANHRSSSVASSTHVGDLHTYFPNLEEFELSFNSREIPADSYPTETTTFVDNLARFQNLRRLILTAEPDFIDGPLDPLTILHRSRWVAAWPIMVRGNHRMAKYKARAVGAATKIFGALRAGKKGVQFEKLILNIEGYALCKFRKGVGRPYDNSGHWGGKCVPKLSCTWMGVQDSGEPLVWVDVVEECVNCQAPAIGDEL